MNSLRSLLQDADPLRHEPRRLDAERERIQRAIRETAPIGARTRSVRVRVPIAASLATALVVLVAVGYLLWVHGPTRVLAAVLSIRGATRGGSAGSRVGSCAGQRFRSAHLPASGNCREQRRRRPELGGRGSARAIWSRGAVPASRGRADAAGNRKPRRSTDGRSRRWSCCHGTGRPVTNQRLSCHHRKFHTSRGGKNRRRHCEPLTR